jgi:hypothetical protein
MSQYVDLAFNLDELASLFGDPLPISNPEVLNFWFEYQRSDGATITLSLSGYERSVAVIVRCSDAGPTTSVRFDLCDSVRVLEPERKTLEIVGQSPPLRCFMALDGEATLGLTVPAAR